MSNSRNHFLNNLASTKSRYNLGAGVPPISLYPQFKASEYLAEIEKTSGENLLNYHQTPGYIRETAATAIEVNEGISIDFKNIAVTNGVQEAIALILSCFRTKTVACLDPSYPGFEDAAMILGCKLIKLNLKTWLTDIEALAPESLLYLSSDFSNPRGSSLTEEERIRLTEIAEKKNFYIFDDATYRPFYLDAPIRSLYSINPERVIHAISFSKILAPGLRTAFVYLPSSLAPVFINNKANLSLNNSGITQALIEFWLKSNNYQLSAHLGLAKKRLKENQKVLQRYKIDYNGGFFCTFELDKNVDYSFCDTLLKREQIAVLPMQLFSDNKLYMRQLRLCIANVDNEDLETVLQVLLNF